MKKGGFLRNVLDTIRSNPTSQHAGGSSSSSGGSARGAGSEFGGQLKANHFSVGQVSRHGFPEQPTALAYDPVQKIAAIGTKSGALRVFGRPGVDVWAQHKSGHAVTHIKFIINQGAIITVTSDESIHLWSLRGPNLKIQVSASGQQGGSSPAAHSPSPASATTSNLSSAISSHQQTSLPASGAQPGDPDYLTDQLTHGAGAGGSSSSPTGIDQSKQLFKQPEILHTLKFEREHITCLHQTLMSKWLYIGTERGNVHVANVETFELSGYSIAWNKAIELSRKTHPGSIIHISECPQDTNKLLIGYESGCIALWDLKSRSAEGRYYYADNLLWLAWHYEGKQFVAAHGDGSLVTWQTRSNAKPVQIVHPHARSAPSQGEQGDSFAHQHLASSFARSLNNELYRPINKVEWKTSKSSNEQFLLFSGGLPYAGLEQEHQQPPVSSSASHLNHPLSRQSAGASPLLQQQQQQGHLQANQQQHLKAASASPSAHLASPSPISPSVSPSSAHDSGFKSVSRQSALNQQQQQQQQLQHSRERKCLRSTSLTVMFGKSITVLEMDETIIDFITVCDNSPYENDCSDPFAVLVLLSNDLILIDLTSSGYPSFDSPYPAASLNESPVTCIQYLADCSNDLIPFLYSTSPNVMSRVPKKGFSDKEWPINGGEWGQAMQSYPELVLTGHADGTIKFWDMSSVNFDLISKLKTAKLFEKPNKPISNLVIVAHSHKKPQHSSTTAKPNSPHTNDTTCDFSFASSSSNLNNQLAAGDSDTTSLDQQRLDGNYFAIEQIEYCASTKHLLVAGAMSQVIRFRLNKGSSGGSGQNDISVVLVEPQQINHFSAAPATTSGGHESNQQAQQQQKLKQHLLLRARSGDTASGAGSSSSSSSARSRLSGFQPELICLTPLLMQGNSLDDVIYCYAPPKVTALACQATHNILAYSHENGIVLVDIIQKCVIMNASLSELYGGPSVMTSQRDIVSIEPFATSSILLQHYQSGASAAAATTSTTTNLSGLSSCNNTISSGAGEFQRPKTPLGTAGGSQHHSGAADHPTRFARAEGQSNDNGGTNDNGIGGNPALASSLHKLSGANELSSAHSQLASQQQPPKSRFTTNSMFQRQLSTNALNASQQAAAAASSRPSSGSAAAATNRLLARQMTASQLLGGGSTSQPKPLELAGSTSCLAQGAVASHSGSATPTHGRALSGSTARSEQQQAAAPPPSDLKRPAKNKRIISRMLSISAIHTSSSPPQQQHPSPAPPPPAASLTAATASHSREATPSTGDNLQANDMAPSSMPPTATNMTMTATAGDQAPDKIDSSFTRSRSSSCSSNAPNDANHQQQATSGESIQCLCFLDWTLASQPASPAPASAVGNNNKSLDSQASPPAGQLALWLGTSQGCVLLVSLTMPDSEDNRVLQLQSVQADPIPQATIKLPGAILCLASFSSICSPSCGSSGQHLASQSSSLEGELVSAGGPVAPSSGSAAAAAALRAQDSSASSSTDLDRGSSMFLTIVSEKQAKVFKIPAHHAAPLNGTQHHSTSKSSIDHHHHQHHHHDRAAAKQPQQDLTDSPMAKLLINKSNCFAKVTLSDTSFACHAGLVQMRQPDECCLAAYLATGHLMVYSLPQLRQLMEAEFVPYTNARIGQSMRFSRNGHALYQPSVGEICKFTFNAQYKALVQEMSGSLYVPREMPEMPRANFFKSLFSAATSSAASRQSDRDELFGESSAGKASRGVAKHISSGGSQLSAMDKLKSAAVGSMGHEMRMAREGLDERGEKLGEIEDRTLQMMNQSETYAQAAHQLAQKFKDKKWYQF